MGETYGRTVIFERMWRGGNGNSDSLRFCPIERSKASDFLRFHAPVRVRVAGRSAPEPRVASADRPPFIGASPANPRSRALNDKCPPTLWSAGRDDPAAPWGNRRLSGGTRVSRVTRDPESADLRAN